MAALLAAARANPGRITYGSGGNGSISHIVGESFKKEAGVDLLHVPYKGQGPAMVDLAAGVVDLLFDGFATAGQQHKSGAMRILATNGRRHPDYPDLPTFAEAGVPGAEAGVPGYEADTWNCLIVPKGTSRPIIERINRALNRALDGADIRKRSEGFGAQNMLGSTRATAPGFAAAQRARWVPLVRAMNIKVE